MVAGRRTRARDLVSTRSHRFATVKFGEAQTVCLDCWVSLDTTWGQLDLPECPGPGYMLINRNTQSLPTEVEGKHKRGGVQDLGTVHAVQVVWLKPDGNLKSMGPEDVLQYYEDWQFTDTHLLFLVNIETSVV